MHCYLLFKSQMSTNNTNTVLLQGERLLTFFQHDITQQYIHISVVQGKQREQKKEELLKKVKSHDNHHHICFLTEIETQIYRI